MKGKVIFIGAGPGDPDLVTVKGRNVIEKADVIVYAGSLVNKEVLNPRKEDCVVYNSAVLNLEETTEICREATSKGQLVARVHTGDPSIYGAIGEQIRELQKYDIEYDIIPGVSSLFGTASVLETELTLPEISQTVIITRPEGRTPKPRSESISSLSKHQATMCIFLGIGMIDKVVDELLVGYCEDSAIAVVKKATWDEQVIIRGTLKNIAQKVKESNMRIIYVFNTDNYRFLDDVYLFTLAEKSIVLDNKTEYINTLKNEKENFILICNEGTDGDKIKENLSDKIILSGSFCAGKCNRVGVTIFVNNEIYTGITAESIAQFFDDKIKPLL